MLKILITGTNGLLGQKLVSLAAKRNGIEILGCGRGPCRITELPPNFQYAECDITNPGQVLVMFGGFSPDAVIHTAAMTNVDECELNPEACSLQNVEAVKDVIAACEKSGAHLIHLSTDFIFDGKDGPYKEEARPNPISIYGESKYEAEKMVKNASCAWSIVRTVLVYGIAPGLSRSNIILWVKDSLEKGKEIQVVDDQFRTPTLAEDLAMGCLLIAEKNAEGIFNISGKDFLTPYDMALQTADYFGLHKDLIKKASAATFSQPAKRPPRTGFIIEKAIRELGYAPHSFAEGIEILAGQMNQLSGS